MAAEPVDVLVVGGGITGAGIARDAALRGFRTAVVDKGDFASGTSSHSSRLIHGGLRYLEQYEFHLVREASRERRVLLKVAPHLVRPLPFVLPAYRGARVPPWRLRAGLWLYDLLAGFRNVGLHRWLGRKATLRLEPGLRDKDLRGAAVYFDAQTDDARLTLATMRAAAQAGALVASHADVTALLKPDGRIRGAAVRDMLSGDEYSVRALVVVNATGPWVDQVRRLEDPAAESLLRLTKGAHVAVPRQRMGHVRRRRRHAAHLRERLRGRSHRHERRQNALLRALHARSPRRHLRHRPQRDFGAADHARQRRAAGARRGRQDEQHVVDRRGEREGPTPGCRGTG